MDPALAQLRMSSFPVPCSGSVYSVLGGSLPGTGPPNTRSESRTRGRISFKVTDYCMLPLLVSVVYVVTGIGRLLQTLISLDIADSTGAVK